MRQTYIKRLGDDLVIGYVICLPLLYQHRQLGERQHTSFSVSRIRG